MKLTVLLACLLMLAYEAAADPLDPLIEAYEAFVREGDPGEAARAEGAAQRAATALPRCRRLRYFRRLFADKNGRGIKISRN